MSTYKPVMKNVERVSSKPLVTGYTTSTQTSQSSLTSASEQRIDEINVKGGKSLEKVAEETEQALQDELHALRTRVQELEQNEAILREEQRMMDEFLNFASHQLRTPLTTINGNIQLVKRRLQAAMLDEQLPEEVFEKFDPMYEMLNRAERQVHIQSGMVDSLLDTARIQAHRLELHQSPLNMVELAQSTIEKFRATTPNRQINLTISQQDPIIVYADPERIKQVLTNYITNAMRYSAPDRPIQVQLKLHNHTNPTSATLCVHDEGPGIQEEDRERVWQRFYQIPSVKIQSGSGAGLGLGLHISKTIIERHGGQVGVTSTPGQGSTFWFTLPLMDPHP